jgi:hypothetical protein
MTLEAWNAMASRKLDKARRKKDQRPKRLFKQARGPAIPPGHRVVSEPAGLEKMSDALEELVEPYADLAKTGENYRKLLDLGMMAWNIALLPADERQAIIDEMIETGLASDTASARAHAREIVETLVRRKEKLFAANQRLIVSFELRDTRDGFHLTVASTI